MRGVDERSEAGGSMLYFVIRTPPCPSGASPLINEGGEGQYLIKKWQRVCAAIFH